MASFDDIAADVFAAPKQEESTDQSVTAPVASPWDTIYQEATTQNQEERPTPVAAPTPPDASTKSFEGNTISLAIPLPGMTDKRFDTGIPMPASAGKAFAQFGSGLADVGLGLDQIMGKATTADADAKKRLDDPLNKGFWGTVNNMAGKAAPFVAGAAGALPFAGSAPAWLAATAPIAYGGAQGFAEPVESYGPGRGLNTAVGALTAGMGPMASKAMGLGGDQIAGPLAREAAAQGYKVTPADTKSSGIINFMRDKFAGTPIIGKSAKVDEFNRAKFTDKVASSWGGNAQSIADPAKFTQDGADIATKITGVYKNNPLTITNQFEKKLELVGNKVAASDSGRNEVKKITDEIAGARVFDKKTGTYTADGEKIQTVLENLEAKMRGDPKSEMNKVRQKLHETIKAEYTGKLKPEDAERLEKSLSQRQAWDAMKDYAAKSSRGEGNRARGSLSPDDVAAAARAMQKSGISTADLDKTVEVGQHILRPTKSSPLISAGGGAALGASGAVPALMGAPLFSTAAPIIAGINKGINSPMMYNIGKNPIVAGALNRAGSQVARPIITQGALSATEGVSDTMHKGQEEMKRYLGR